MCQMRHNFVGVFVGLFYTVVFRFPRGQGMFFFSKATTLSSGRILSRAFCPGMKRLEREADHPLPISRNTECLGLYSHWSIHLYGVGPDYAQGQIEFVLFPLIDTGSDPLALTFNITAISTNVTLPQ